MTGRTALLVLLSLVAASAAAAQNTEPFYKGKTIHFTLSAGVAGGYAIYGRAFADHLPDHLAGKPTIVVESMEGAGGLRATNYLFNAAPKDGTVLGLVHAAAPLAPLLGNKAAQFDPRKFNWLGSMDQAVSECGFYDSPIRSWADLKDKPSLVGSTGAGSEMEVMPTLLNQMFGTKIKIISGYKDGNEVFLAMARGEVQGRCSNLGTTLQGNHPEWLAPVRKIFVPVVMGRTRDPLFPDSPTILELTDNVPIRQQLELIFVTQTIDRPVLAPPGVPQERVAELRAAFVATMKDAAFLAEAKKLHMETNYITGEEVDAVFAQAYATPPEVIEAVKRIQGSPAGN
jgi:tripartite-type tricarboxylate transporter receptor subunit TctC